MKRNMKRFVVLLLALAMVITMLPNSAAVQAAKKPKLSKKSITLQVGKSKKLTVKNKKGTLTWKSKSKKIATVSKKGVVKAKKAGKTTITATLKNKGKKTTLKCSVKVTKKKATTTSATQTQQAPVVNNPVVNNPVVNPTAPTPGTQVTPVPVRSYRVTGTYSRNGSAAGNQKLRIVSSSRTYSVVTMGNGSFSATLPIGNYSVYYGDTNIYISSFPITDKDVNLNLLSAGYIIEGSITSSAGNALGGIDVSLLEDGEEWHITATDSQGKYSLGFVSNGDYELVINGDEASKQSLTVSGADIKGKNFSMDIGGIKGRLLDLSNQPIANQTVQVYRVTDDGTEHVTRFTTDSEGGYSIGLVEGSYRLYFNNNKTEDIAVEKSFVEYDFATGMVKVEGTLLRHGQSFPNEDLSFRSSNYYYSTYTNDSSSYSIYLKPGTYDVSCKDSSVGTIVVAEDGTSTGTALSANLSKVSGVVVDANGNPPSDPNLRFCYTLEDDDDSYYANYNDDTGEFSCYLPERTYTINCFGKSIRTITVGSSDIENQRIQVDTFTVSGIIKENGVQVTYTEDDDDGVSYVIYTSDEHKYVCYCNLKEDNTFTATLPSGTYQLCRSDTNNVYSASFTVSSSKDSLSIDLSLAFVSGKYFVNGEAQGGNWLYVYSDDNGVRGDDRSFDVYTDSSDGSYSVILAPGVYYIRASNSDTYHKIEVVEGQNTKDIVDSEYTIKGNVVDADGEELNLSKSFNLYLYNEQGDKVDYTYLSTNRKDSSYAFDIAEPGTYHVEIDDIDCGTIEVSEYETVQDITYPKHCMKLTMIDKGGEPIVNTYFDYSLKDSSQSSSFYTDAKGCAYVYVTDGTYDITWSSTTIESVTVEGAPCEKEISLDAYKLSGALSMNGKPLDTSKWYNFSLYGNSKYYTINLSSQRDSYYAYVPDGTYKVYFNNIQIDSVTISGANATKALSFLATMLSGTCAYKDGTPMTGQYVAFTNSYNNSISVYPDKDAKYTILLPVGTYNVSGMSVPLVVSGEEQTQNFTLDYYQISGVLRDSNGNVCENKSLYFYQNGINRGYAYTNENGEFKAKVDKTGTYTVECNSETVGTVTIVDKCVTQNFVIAARYEVSGQLKSKNGDPLLSEQYINLYSDKSKSNYVTGTRSDEEGKYSFSLKAGIYYAFVDETPMGSITVSDSDVTQDLYREYCKIHTKFSRAGNAVTDQIQLKDADDEYYHLYLDDDGCLDGLVPEGTYTMYLNGYYKASNKLEVTTDIIDEEVEVNGIYIVSGQLTMNGEAADSDKSLYLSKKVDGSYEDPDYTTSTNTGGTFSTTLESGDYAWYIWVNYDYQKLLEFSVTDEDITGQSLEYVEPVYVDGFELESDSYSVDVTDLNETTLTSATKRSDGLGAQDSIYYQDSGVTFASAKDYNSGVSYYINSCKSKDQLVDISDIRGDGSVTFMGYNDGAKDVSAYDYIALDVTSESQLILRAYDNTTVINTKGFPATSTELYEGGSGWITPEDYMYDDGGTGMVTYNSYKTRTLYIPVSLLSQKGCNLSTLAALAISPMREGTTVKVNRISFVKKKIVNPVESISVSSNADSVQNGRSVVCNVTVNPSNATRNSVKWTSSNTDLATVDMNGAVTAAKTGTGTVSIRATALDGSEVYGETELEVVENTTVTETVTMNLAKATIKAGSGAGATAQKTSKGIEFAEDETMNYVNFSSYLTANDMTIQDYKGISVSYKVVDQTGAIADNEDASYGKIAFVDADNLNGYKDIEITGWLNDAGTKTQGTKTFDFDTYTITDVASVAGFNIQFASLPSGSHVVITEIKLIGTNEVDE